MKIFKPAGFLALALVAGLSMPAMADRHGERGEHGEGGEHGIKAVTDAAVLKECGACQMAFQPGFLPAASWTKLMGDLKNHFGDNATLDAATAQKISDYLTVNAADAKGGKAPAVVAGTETPLRISDLPWFHRKHDKRGRSSPENLKRHNAKSMADCKACHTGADKGYFEDD